MLIKTLMFVRVIVLLYPNIEQGGRGIFSKRGNSLFSGLKWTTVKVVQPSQLLLSVIESLYSLNFNVVIKLILQ